MVSLTILILGWWVLRYEMEEYTPFEGKENSRFIRIMDAIQKWVSKKKNVVGLIIVGLVYTVLVTLIDISIHGNQYNIVNYFLRQTHTILLNFNP